jgi:hypothetical protein
MRNDGEDSHRTRRSEIQLKSLFLLSFLFGKTNVSLGSADSSTFPVIACEIDEIWILFLNASRLTTHNNMIVAPVKKLTGRSSSKTDHHQ